MGEDDFKDECSNGRSLACRQVTLPTGNLDPYLLALPCPNHTSFLGTIT